MSEQFWDAIAPSEELDLDDQAINRELRWRTIERHLDQVESVLDVGGATGAFSVQLAKRGFRVTHFDLSAAMLECARTRASAEGVTLELVQGDAADLSRFADRQFDLVLNMDGAISFAGERAAQVIAESCRVTGKTLIVTVSNQACMVPTWIKYSIKAANRILPAVHEMMRTGSWDKDQFSENALIYPSVCGIAKLKAFTAAELTALLQASGMAVASSRGLGSLTHLLMPHGSPPIPTKELVELCEAYDTTVLPGGPGSFRRAGLLAVAHSEHRG
jgi:ubiquinone/menaquinone biosynthesis C-methylase UbiE